MFEELKEYAVKNHVPIIRSESGKLLCDEVKKKNPKKILEIGTAIGYSALLMLSNCKALVTTIEKDETRAEIAENNFKKYEVTERVNLIRSDAQIALEKLSKNNEKFDFVFLDGPKGQYYKYLPFIKEMLLPNGTLFADNVYMGGLVLSIVPVPHKQRSMVNNMRKFLDLAKRDCDFDVTIFNIEDGIAIINKK